MRYLKLGLLFCFVAVLMTWSVQAIWAERPAAIAFFADEKEAERRDGDRPPQPERRPDGDRESARRPEQVRERPDRPDAERIMRQLRERMESLAQQSAKLRAVREKLANRDSEDAKHIERQLHEIEAEMTRVRQALTSVNKRAESPRDSDREPPRPRGAQDEARHRIENLRRASAHLREAGFEEQAKRIAEQAEHIERELRDRGVPREREHAERPDGREVRELREEVQNLRRELHELRGLLRGVLDKQGKDDRAAAEDTDSRGTEEEQVCEEDGDNGDEDDGDEGDQDDGDDGDQDDGDDGDHDDGDEDDQDDGDEGNNEDGDKHESSVRNPA